MFTLTQWLILVATAAIPAAVGYLFTLGAGALVDRQVRRYREIDGVLQQEG